jgi:hypothetical protein
LGQRAAALLAFGFDVRAALAFVFRFAFAMSPTNDLLRGF